MLGGLMPKAYGFTAHGGPEAEAFLDVSRPVPGPGQLLVAVRAAGVNPVDWKRRAGLRAPSTPPPALPVVFGSEVAEVGIWQPGHPLHRAPEALRVVEQGHARGKIVIEVAPG